MKTYLVILESDYGVGKVILSAKSAQSARERIIIDYFEGKYRNDTCNGMLSNVTVWKFEEDASDSLTGCKV